MARRAPLLLRHKPVMRGYRAVFWITIALNALNVGAFVLLWSPWGQVHWRGLAA